jgi:hypothetical protein
LATDSITALFIVDAWLPFLASLSASGICTRPSVSSWAADQPPTSHAILH